MGSLVVLKLFKQDEATLVTKAHLREATIVVLSNVEKMLADTASQLFNRTIVAIWDDWRDVHTMLRPFRSITHAGRGKDTTTMSTRRPTQHMMALETACVNSDEEWGVFARDIGPRRQIW